MGNIIYAIVVLGALGALFGLILSVASKIFEVKKDPREEAILSHLAGANCGGCGYPGCAGCAAAILAGNAPVNACAPAGPDNAAAIAEIMGMAAPSGERQVAFVRCNGGEAAKKRFEYVGVHDCLSATKVAAGPLDCRFGCLGFGSCISACQFGAMSIGPNGTAVVDPEKCTNCGACMKACPRGLITSVPASKKVHVACANQDKGKAAMSVCGNSCIGCGLCEKECKKDAIHVVNGVAVIDYDKCVGCKLCTKVCPRDAILPKATAEEKEKYKAIKKAQAEKAAAAKKAQEEAAKKAKAEAAKRAAEEAAKKEAEIKAAATKTAYNQLVASASAARPVAYSTTYLASDAIKANALDADVIYACGPTPMLRALKAYSQEKGILCYLSLEEKMACGIGACLACTCQTKDVDEHSQVHNKRICKDGPVFLAEDIEL